jgi:hypothetical protein
MFMMMGFEVLMNRRKALGNLHRLARADRQRDGFNHPQVLQSVAHTDQGLDLAQDDLHKMGELTLERVFSHQIQPAELKRQPP